MNYIYSVERIDNTIDPECTIGNALLSKDKLSNYNQLKFKNQCCYKHRNVVYADTFNISVYSTHFESGTGVSDLIQAIIIRSDQIKEIIEITKSSNQKLNIISGDFNSPIKYLDPTNIALKLNG